MVHKASILDSNGHISDSIDAVVYDRQYTPTLLDSDSHRYIPPEAVYAIFECKPTISKSYLEYAAEKAASVRRLTRTSVTIPHAGGRYPPKSPFEIVAGIIATEVQWEDGFADSFEKCQAELCGLNRLGCVLGYALISITQSLPSIANHF